MSRWRLTVPVLLAIIVATPGAAQAPAAKALGRRLTEWLYLGQGDSIYAHMDPETQKGVGSPAAFQNFKGMIEEQGGFEVAIASEEVLPEADGKSVRYERRVRFSKVPEIPILVQWVFGPDGKVTGFDINSD